MIDFKELKKVIGFLRKAGVSEFKSDGLEIKLMPEAPPSPYKKRKMKSNPVPESTLIETDGPSPSELLFWSSGGVPSDEEV